MTVEPITAVEVVGIVQSLVSAFEDSIYLSVTLMMAFAAAWHIKRLMVD